MRALPAAIVALAACGTTTLDLLPLDASSDAPDGTASDGGNEDASDDVTEEMCGTCPCGLRDCGGTCVDVGSDPLHCGGCTGTPLAHNQYCRAGVPECLPGLTLCGTACADLKSNPDHCGGCNATPCAQGEKCENGACASGACSGGLLACAVAGRTACVDASRGWPYCGSCSLVCAPDQLCAGDACAPYAPATPCSACPCASDCARAVRDSGAVSCCPPITSGAPPECIAAASCPP